MNTSLEATTIDSLVRQLIAKDDDGKLDLNPEYQRDVVWDESMRMRFIDSVIRGYIPNNIIINKGDLGKWTCIDGKQRLTSILQFYQNEIPREYEDTDGEMTYVYFSKIPNNSPYDADRTMILTEEDQYSKFLDRKIPVAYYIRLDYDIQTDIFNRIQNSKVSTEGERIFSRFSKEAVAKEFKDFCLEMAPFFGMTKNSRYVHATYILSIMYSNHLDKLTPLTPKARDSFIKELDDLNVMKNMILKVRDIIKITMDKNFLRSKTINALNLRKNFLLGMIHLIDEYFEIESIEKENRLNIIAMVKTIWLAWDRKTNNHRSLSSLKAMTILSAKFDAEYKKMYEEIDDSDNDASEDNSGSDTDDDDQDDQDSDSTESLVDNDELVKTNTNSSKVKAKTTRPGTKTKIVPKIKSNKGSSVVKISGSNLVKMSGSNVVRRPSTKMADSPSSKKASKSSSSENKSKSVPRMKAVKATKAQKNKKSNPPLIRKIE